MAYLIEFKKLQHLKDKQKFSLIIACLRPNKKNLLYLNMEVGMSLFNKFL